MMLRLYKIVVKTTVFTVYYYFERNNMYKNVHIPTFNALTATDTFISQLKIEPNEVKQFSWNCYQIRRSKLVSETC